jgi:hypothetical protein
MLLYVDWERVTDVSKKHVVFVNIAKQSKNSLLNPEDEGAKILRNVGNYLPVDTA